MDQIAYSACQSCWSCCQGDFFHPLQPNRADFSKALLNANLIAATFIILFHSSVVYLTLLLYCCTGRILVSPCWAKLLDALLLDSWRYTYSSCKCFTPDRHQCICRERKERGKFPNSMQLVIYLWLRSVSSSHKIFHLSLEWKISYNLTVFIAQYFLMPGIFIYASLCIPIHCAFSWFEDVHSSSTHLAVFSFSPLRILHHLALVT